MSSKGFWVFLSEIVRKPAVTGAIAPSSKYLGYAISEYIKPKEHPLKVIEVGPGTGAFTKIIADKLSQEDQLDVIEFNPEFVKVLEEKFKDYKNVHIHCVSIVDWKPDYKYDYMVSSLPFNVFDTEFVKIILSHYENIMKSGAIISYFEYLFFPKAKKEVLSGSKKVNFIKLHDVLRSFRRKYEFGRTKVYKNFPPACVYNLRMY